MPGIDVSDLLKLMEPKMNKKQELDMNLITKEEKEAKIKELTT